ncbi:MAG TPA: M48 family metallopeptidase [Candidatus Elarobacter sp.]|jgi:predicted Zn-dependent protease|nr:M48 family metallopeptidase [Candidatus Elarobacter sp.]
MRRLLALAMTAALTAAAGAAPASAQSDAQIEMQIGQQEYQALQQKGEIITSSPYYAILNPIAQQIKRVADPQYPTHPFNFILVHETAPNAFAVPGGNVYVTDALMRFAQNREELAGVLCHETSHTIHHDVLNLYKKQQRVATTYTIADVLANVLTGGRSANTIGGAANMLFTLQTQGFSREVESAADHKGAQTCAEAGSNPWGLVWLFQQFEKSDTGGQMEVLSDHPTDEHRIEDLKREFASDPALFGRYSSSIATATPLGQNPRGTTTGMRSGTSRTAAYRPVAKKGKGMFPPGSGYKF